MAQQRQFAWPTYLVAFTLALIPLFDVIMQLIPMRPQDAKWRFGALGLVSNALIIPVVGIMVAFYAAAYFDHRRFQRVLGVIALLLAVTVVLMLGLFCLDTLQLRREVNPKLEFAFKAGSITAAFKSIVSAIALFGFAWASFRAPKLARPAKEVRPGGLVIGAKPIARPVALPKPETPVPVAQDTPT
jgi:EamA domain-containing membrane protein RarD